MFLMAVFIVGELGRGGVTLGLGTGTTQNLGPHNKVFNNGSLYCAGAWERGVTLGLLGTCDHKTFPTITSNGGFSPGVFHGSRGNSKSALNSRA